MKTYVARNARPVVWSVLALAALLPAACATVDPNAPPPVPANAAESTRTEANGDVVTEYRVNGALAMVRISPKRGPVYYLVDSDGDGRITFYDLNASANKGKVTDVDKNGRIDAADYAAWQSHFGQPPGSGAGTNSNASVPEPPTLVLFLAVLVLFPYRPKSMC